MCVRRTLYASFWLVATPLSFLCLLDTRRRAVKRGGGPSLHFFFFFPFPLPFPPLVLFDNKPDLSLPLLLLLPPLSTFFFPSLGPSALVKKGGKTSCPPPFPLFVAAAPFLLLSPLFFIFPDCLRLRRQRKVKVATATAKLESESTLLARQVPPRWSGLEGEGGRKGFCSTSTSSFPARPSLISPFVLHC